MSRARTAESSNEAPPAEEQDGPPIGPYLATVVSLAIRYDRGARVFKVTTYGPARELVLTRDVPEELAEQLSRWRDLWGTAKARPRGAIARRSSKD